MPREIFYANLTVQNGKVHEMVKEVVYKDVDGYYRNPKKFKEPVKVLRIDVIKSLGFEVEPSGYTEVKKSDESRNKISGTYE